MLVCHKDIGDFLRKFFRAAQNELIVISAYCTSDALRGLLASVSPGVRVTLVTRWDKDDIARGASNLGVFQAILDKAGRMYMNPNLHAKLFMIDKKGLVFGSANVTRRGTGMAGDKSNIECLSAVQDVHHSDICFVNWIIENSTTVDVALVEELKQQMEDKRFSEWNYDRLRRVSRRPEGIFVNDFPFLESPEMLLSDPLGEEATHDCLVFGLKPKEINKVELQGFFSESKVIKWLEHLTDTEMSFGRLTALIHASLLDDPLPYRKEIKVLAANLFNWIVDLLPNKYEVYTPAGKHSKILKKL